MVENSMPFAGEVIGKLSTPLSLFLGLFFFGWPPFKGLEVK